MNPVNGAHIRANGIRQHYLHFPGSGPAILVIPGIVSPAMLWCHVGQWLSQDYDCYVLDVRGRGLTEAGPHLDYGFDACAADVAAFVEAKGLDRPIVVGHSMGARIALRAARLSPERFAALVLVDPPTSGPGRRPYPVPKERTLALLRAACRGEAAELLRGAGGRPWPAELERLRLEWLPTCDERAVHVAYDDFHGQDMHADVAQAPQPVALICAGRGDVVSDEDITELRGLRKALDCMRLAEVGHQMQAESFEVFRGALDEVLTRLRQHTAGSRN